ncbi:MAG TPA: histidine phosphatase family protein [Actinophytocola sp.]|uniref:histidine phosphatase family protein n=1 Tax=Actinophytocola sp. TaxID=1872138 RepID=UPI002DB79A8E|nr:histidine phosphatase family protein [Actinophytocola sp.]HEU5472721.1 histidine phosphatase family protein [Actinophytocola sp.]
MALTTELLLARHGEAVCNVAGIVGGDQGCTGLTTRGRWQVERLAARLARDHADRPIDVIYTTPRRRAQETAEVVTRTLALPAVIEADLRGPDHGEADGHPWHEVKSAFGGPPQHNPDQPYAAGSESWNTYLDRATRTLEDILSRYDGHRVLVLAHGETIEAAHTLLLNLPPGTCRHARFVTDHACLTHWQRHINRLNQAVWMLLAHNDIRHLSEDQP